MAHKRKRIFDGLYAQLEETDGNVVLFSARGEPSVIFEITNPVQQLCTDAQQYMLFHDVLSNILQTIGEGYALQKQDILCRQAYHHDVPDDAEFLTRNYFRYFEGREFTEIRTFLILTQEAQRSQFIQYDPKRWLDFHSKVSKTDDILTEKHIRHRKLGKEEVSEYCHRFMAFQFRHGPFSMTNFKASDEYLRTGDRIIRSYPLVDIDEINLPSMVKPYTQMNINGYGIATDLLSFLTGVPYSDCVVFNQIIQIPGQRKLLRKLQAKAKRHGSMPDPSNRIAKADIEEVLDRLAVDSTMLVYCNFNILVSGQPRVMGVREILKEWTAFRVECVRRRTYYDLHGKEKRLHLLQGLAAILLDIDKAIRIIRTTEEETEVVPNLMIGFGIDEVQADYVAEIKLRHLNREYILKRTGEIEQLEKDIADLNDVLAKPARIRRIIINELNDVAKKYGQPRRSEILYDLPEEDGSAEEEAVPDYPVTVFFTREGYFKKIPPQSLRTAGAHKLKEGDEIIQQVETRNNVEALFFTDKQQVYKVRLAELEDGKVAQMGIFIPGRLGMDEGENVLSMVITSDYSGFMLFFFASGKCAKIPLSSYATKQNRRKLLKAYCDKEPLAKLFFLPEETELAIRTSASRMLLVGTAQIAAKATRDSQGVAVVTLKKNQTIASVVPADTLELANPHRYRVRSLPATGALLRAEDEGEQMSLL